MSWTHTWKLLVGNPYPHPRTWEPLQQSLDVEINRWVVDHPLQGFCGCFPAWWVASLDVQARIRTQEVVYYQPGVPVKQAVLAKWTSDPGRIGGGGSLETEFWTRNRSVGTVDPNVTPLASAQAIHQTYHATKERWHTYNIALWFPEWWGSPPHEIQRILDFQGYHERPELQLLNRWDPLADETRWSTPRRAVRTNRNIRARSTNREITLDVEAATQVLIQANRSRRRAP